MVENPPCHAWGSGSIPGQGTKILHAMERQSPQATARQFLRHNKKSCVLHLRPMQPNKYSKKNKTSFLSEPKER